MAFHHTDKNRKRRTGWTKSIPCASDRYEGTEPTWHANRRKSLMTVSLGLVTGTRTELVQALRKIWQALFEAPFKLLFWDSIAMHRSAAKRRRYDRRTPLAGAQGKLYENQGELRPGAKEGL